MIVNMTEDIQISTSLGWTFEFGYLLSRLFVLVKACLLLIIVNDSQATVKHSSTITA